MSNTTTEKPSLDTLLDKNLHNLINATAYKYYAKYTRSNRDTSIMVTQEDLALEGYLAVTKAYESFNATRGFTDDYMISFRTYVHPYITNAMRTYCCRFSHTLSISERAAREDFEAISSIGVIHIDKKDHVTHGYQGQYDFDIPVGSGVDVSQIDMEDYLLQGLSPMERNLVKDHILDGYTLRTIAKRYNIAPSRAGQIIKGLKDRIKEKVERYVKDD